MASHLIRTGLLFCVLSPCQTLADDWPQWMGPHRDGVWREQGITADFSAGEPKISWRAKVAGGYAGPAVADGRVYVTDYVRLEGDATPNPDVRNELRGTERIHCLAEATGRQLWIREFPCNYRISYPAGPRATPIVEDERVYFLGAEGDLRCLNVQDGETIWSRHLPTAYHTKAPVWGYAAHPLLIGDQLICLVGGEGSAVVSFHKHTGRELWKSLSTPDIGYAPPTLIEAGGHRQLIVWHSTSLNSLDPMSGKPYWSEELKPDYAMSIAPPLKVGNLLFVGGIKDKSMVVQLSESEPAAKVVWRGKNGVGVGPSHCPVIVDSTNLEYVYGVDRGGLRCVKLATGEHMWESFALMESGRRSNAGTIFIVPHQDRYFLFSETAELAIAQLSPEGYHELGRTKPLLRPTHNAFGRAVVWSAPAFANRAMFVRNDEELIRVDLGE